MLFKHVNFIKILYFESACMRHLTSSQITIRHKILMENIDKFDKFPAICQFFLIKIFYLVSYLQLMNLWYFGSTQNKIISLRRLQG